MALHIRDPETDAAVRKLARRTGLTMTEAVRVAVEEKLAALEPAAPDRRRPLLDRIADLQARIAAYPETGLLADKAFYDSLSDEE